MRPANVLQIPGREDDPYDINYAAPAKLAAAGVRFAITSGDCCSEVRNLPSYELFKGKPLTP